MPVIELAKNTPKEAVCLVFEKVNTGGVILNVFELATASFAMDDEFSLREDWDARRYRMRTKNSVLQDVDGDRFLQVITLLKTQEDRRQALAEGKTGNQLPAIGCRKRDILDLTLNDYRAWADKVESGFISAAEFLNSQYVFGKKNVPYATQLVPLAALYVELGDEARPGRANGRLEQWYWTGVFGEVYGGPTETLFAQDLVQVASFVRDGTVPQMLREATFIPERLVSLRTRQSAAYKGVFALQMKYQAKDWIVTTPLNLSVFHEKAIDIHHIFPAAWCDKNKIQNKIYNSIINKTPMDSTTNKRIGGRAPSIYLDTIRRNIPDSTTDGELNSLLESHWANPALLKDDDFVQFFVDRGQRMLDSIGKAMGRNLGDGKDVFRNALTDARIAGISDMYVEDEPEDPEIGEDEQAAITAA